MLLYGPIKSETYSSNKIRYNIRCYLENYKSSGVNEAFIKEQEGGSVKDGVVPEVDGSPDSNRYQNIYQKKGARSAYGTRGTCFGP